MRFSIRFVISAALAACTPGAGGEALAPKNPTAADLFGIPPKCAVNGFGQPLIVDMPSAVRADIEVGMKQGIVVVQHDCTTLKVLPTCHLDGTYRFLGITPKDDLVSIDKSDELSANLPFSAVSLGGRLKRGQALHVAMSMVGKQASTRRQVRRDELEGDCAGATHFIQGALVGAFVMRSATLGEIHTAAEVFGVGAKGSSSSSQQVSEKDGTPSACRKAKAGVDVPVADCNSPLRLDLVPLDGLLPERDDPLEVVAERCPDGWRLSESKCTRDAVESHQCKYGDVPDCTAQCAAGNAESCTILGYMHVKAEGVAKDDTKAKTLFQKACEGASAAGCFELAIRSSDLGERGRLYLKACDGGHARSCTFSGFMAQYGMGGAVDYTSAATRTRRGCDGGDSMGCATLGDLYTMGRGVPKDEAQAVTLYERACEARDIYGCGSLALMQAYGFHLKQDDVAARKLLDRTCNPQASPTAAGFSIGPEIGWLPDTLGGLSVDVFSRSCPGFQELDVACADCGDARSCTIRALSQISEAEGREKLRKGCAGGDPYACVIESKQGS